MGTRTDIDSNPLGVAREALRRQDYSRARGSFEEHLAACPDDLEARLELGLAELLGGDEARFAATYDDVAASVQAGQVPVTGRLAQLWEMYQRLAAGLCRAVAVVSMAALPLGAVACAQAAEDRSAAESAPTPVVDVPTPIDMTPPTPAVVTDPVPTPVPGPPPVGPLIPHGSPPDSGQQATAPTPPTPVVPTPPLPPPMPVVVPPTPPQPAPTPIVEPRPRPRPDPRPRPMYGVVRPRPDPRPVARYMVARPRYRAPAPGQPPQPNANLDQLLGSGGDSNSNQ